MQRIMLKSKIHRVTLTGADLHYEGSIALDADLLRAADILVGEQVHVLNVSNNERIITYAIEAAAGSGTVMLNGAAARAGMVGDLLIILTYVNLDDAEISRHTPRIVHVDASNKLV